MKFSTSTRIILFFLILNASLLTHAEESILGLNSDSIYNAAVSYYHNKEYKKAAELFKEALEADKAVLHEGDEVIGNDSHWIASSYYMDGNISEAKKYDYDFYELEPVERVRFSKAYEYCQNCASALSIDMAIFWAERCMNEEISVLGENHYYVYGSNCTLAILNYQNGDEFKCRDYIAQAKAVSETLSTTGTAYRAWPYVIEAMLANALNNESKFIEAITAAKDLYNDEIESSPNTYSDFLRMYLPYLASQDAPAAKELFSNIYHKLKDLPQEQIKDYANLIKAIGECSISYNEPTIGIDLITSVIDALNMDDIYPFLLSDLGVMYKLKGDYEKSAELLNTSIEILKKTYPDEPQAWAEHVLTLGETYDSNREYDLAEKCFKECLGICNKYKDELLDLKALCLHRLAALSTRTNNFKEAIRYLNDCLEFMRKNGADNPEAYAFIYEELGTCYSSIDKTMAKDYYVKAISLLKETSNYANNPYYVDAVIKCMDIDSPVEEDVEYQINSLLNDITPSDPLSIINRINIYQFAANYFSSQHKYSKALTFINQAVECVSELPDFDNTDIYSLKCILEILNGNPNKAWDFAEQQYNSTANRYGKNSVQHVKAIYLFYIITDQTVSLDKVKRFPVFADELLHYAQTLRKDDPFGFNLQINAAKFYYFINPQKSLEILSDLDSILKNTPHKPDITTITSLYSCLNTLHRDRGDFDKAVTYCHLIQDNLGSITGTSAILSILNNIGQTYILCNKFREAENVLLQACSIAESTDEECAELYFIYESLANLYGKMGQSDLVIDYNRKKYAYIKQFKGSDFFDIYNKINKLWSKYNLDMKEECLSDIEAIESFISGYEGKINVDTSSADRLKAIYYFKEGDYAIATAYIEKALAKVINIDNLKTAANIHMAADNHSEALECTYQCLELMDNATGTSQMDYSYTYKTLGDLYMETQEFDKSLYNYRKSLDTSVQFIADNFLTLTSKQRTDFWNNNSSFFHTYLPYIAMTKSFPDEINGLLYDACLFSNGLLLSADKQIVSIINQIDDEEAKSLYNDYVAKKMVLTKMTEEHNNMWQRLSTPEHDDYDTYFKSEDDLKNYRLLCDATERDLVNLLNKKHSNLLSYRTYTWKDIQSSLSKSSAAIEFLDFPIDEGFNAIGALVIRKGYTTPSFRVLYQYPRDKKFSIDELYNHTTLGDSVIAPLADLISDCDKVYYGTQGLLSTISLTDLPLSNPQTFANSQFYRLSSTRTLLEKKKKIKNLSGTLFGGLNYNLSVDSLVLDADKYPELRKRTLDYETFMRADNRESQALIKPLPGTLTEVQNISKILEAKSRKEPVLKTLDEGTESAFKALSGDYGAILHISTHGFFNAEGVINNPNISVLNYEDLAMEQSGLLLAGATNKYIFGDELPEMVNDGVLKASEIAKLDMQSVDLAVLSACETGLGALTSDGVMGLQRGFKKAGVNSLLMSLWKVDDDATQVLMDVFYKKWLLEDMSKQEALTAAKDYLKSQPQWSNPEFWAAFILLDAI